MEQIEHDPNNSFLNDDTHKFFFSVLQSLENSGSLTLLKEIASKISTHKFFTDQNNAENSSAGDLNHIEESHRDPSSSNLKKKVLFGFVDVEKDFVKNTANSKIATTHALISEQQDEEDGEEEEAQKEMQKNQKAQVSALFGTKKNKNETDKEKKENSTKKKDGDNDDDNDENEKAIDKRVKEVDKMKKKKKEEEEKEKEREKAEKEEVKKTEAMKENNRPKRDDQSDDDLDPTAEDDEEMDNRKLKRKEHENRNYHWFINESFMSAVLKGTDICAYLTYGLIKCGYSLRSLVIQSIVGGPLYVFPLIFIALFCLVNVIFTMLTFFCHPHRKNWKVTVLIKILCLAGFFVVTTYAATFVPGSVFRALWIFLHIGPHNNANLVSYFLSLQLSAVEHYFMTSTSVLQAACTFIMTPTVEWLALFRVGRALDEAFPLNVVST